MTVEAPALVRPIGARYDRQFYTGMAIAAAVVVFIGFSPTFFLRANYESTPLPTYLIVHGVLFTAWIALFLTDLAGSGATGECSSPSRVGDGSTRRGDGRRWHDRRHLVDASSGG